MVIVITRVRNDIVKEMTLLNFNMKIVTMIPVSAIVVVIQFEYEGLWINKVRI